MVRNLNSYYDKYIRKHRKRYSYKFEGRDNNPAHEEFFNSLKISAGIGITLFLIHLVLVHDQQTHIYLMSDHQMVMINFMYVMNTVY